MTRPILTISCCLLGGLTAGTALAQVEREHASHVHGRSEIQLAVEASSFELVLTAPGADIVGFEHAAADAAQQAVIDAALARLNDTDSWLSFAPAGACRVDEADAHTHGFKAAARESGDHDEHGEHGHHHDDNHAHGDQHEGHDHAHGEFHVSIKGRCTTMPNAALIDLHRHFAHIELIVVDLITETGQNRIELRVGNTRVALD